jgi:hypothetical protein
MVVRNPADTRLRAMAEPMMPVPSTATASAVIDFSDRVNEHHRALGLAGAWPAVPRLRPDLMSRHHMIWMIHRSRRPPVDSGQYRT